MNLLQMLSDLRIFLSQLFFGIDTPNRTFIFVQNDPIKCALIDGADIADGIPLNPTNNLKTKR